MVPQLPEPTYHMLLFLWRKYKRHYAMETKCHQHLSRAGRLHCVIPIYVIYSSHEMWVKALQQNLFILCVRCLEDLKTQVSWFITWNECSCLRFFNTVTYTELFHFLLSMFFQVMSIGTGSWVLSASLCVLTLISWQFNLYSSSTTACGENLFTVRWTDCSVALLFLFVEEKLCESVFFFHS